MATKQKLQVHLDWNEIMTDAVEAAMQTPTEKIDSLVRWIESCPNRGGIEVHLNTGRKSEPTRRLQRTLQTLGCTVVARYFMPAMA